MNFLDLIKKNKKQNVKNKRNKKRKHLFKKKFVQSSMTFCLQSPQFLYIFFFKCSTLYSNPVHNSITTTTKTAVFYYGCACVAATLAAAAEVSCYLQQQSNAV